MKNSRTLLFAIGIALATSSYAQFYSLGPQVSRISRYPTIKNIGLHLTTDLIGDDNWGVVASIGYFLPYSYSSTINIPNKNTSQFGVDVHAEDKSSGYQASLMIKEYFIGEYFKKGFGFYGMGGVGIIGFNINAKLDKYDETKYGKLPRSAYEKESGMIFTGHAALGCDYQGKIGSVYFEIQGNFARFLEDETDDKVFVDIPGTLQFNLGYRFFLDKH